LGHDVFFGARETEKARAAAAHAGASAGFGSNRQAAEHGDIVVWNPRVEDAAQVLGDPALLDGKIVLDMNNGPVPADFRFPPIAEAFASRLAKSLPRAHVVKVFNTLAQEVFYHSPETLKAHHVSVFLAGDDRSAKATVAALAAQLGLEPVDAESLDRAGLVEQLGDFIRNMMGGMGNGPFTTLSLVNLPHAAPRFGGRQPSKLY
jgi:8-hydroxy-5-deazaflavin:NADPH oxidoreductase